MNPKTKAQPDPQRAGVKNRLQAQFFFLCHLFNVQIFFIIITGWLEKPTFKNDSENTGAAWAEMFSYSHKPGGLLMRRKQELLSERLGGLLKPYSP